jgi:ubiquinone biosynthesis protein
VTAGSGHELGTPTRHIAGVGDRAARYREVLTVLARHGLGFALPGLRRHSGRGRPASELRAEQVRAAFEELGPTFVKLGQLLSTRRDVVPAAWIEELEKLQDSAPAIDDSAVRRVIEEDLGAPREELFARFDPHPLATASLGQAHAATLQDGTEVVVKVRKPDVVELVHVDLEIIQDLADRATQASRAAADLGVSGLAAQFAASLLSELDYVREGRAADHIGRVFATDAAVHIPRVHWSRTTHRVLTLDRITGFKIDDLAALDAAGIDRRSLVRSAIRIMARMVFVDGVFHADPHPGNLLIEHDGTIGLIDFGMVGHLDERMRERLAMLFVAVSRSDPDASMRGLLAVAEPAGTLDRAALRVDVLRFITLYSGRSLGELRFGALLLRLLALLRRHRLRLHQDLALLVRMLLLVDAIGERLDPTLALAAELRPHAARLAAQRFSPRRVAARARRAGLDAAALGLELPERLRQVLDRVDGDGLDLHLRADELDPLVARMERMGSRLVAGMVTAALVTGIGELTAGGRTGDRRAGRLVDAGLGALGALGAYLAWTARRGRR